MTNAKHCNFQALLFEDHPGQMLCDGGGHYIFTKFISVMGNTIAQIQAICGNNSFDYLCCSIRTSDWNRFIHSGYTEIQQYLAKAYKVIGMKMRIKNSIKVTNTS